MSAEIEPQTALVRPRAVSPDSGDVLPVDELVLSWIGRHNRGVIQIAGGPGSAKSTAIRHLAAVLPPLPHLRYFDPCDRLEAEAFGNLGFAVATTDATSEWNPDPLPYCRLPLAPWGEDDWIEYLLARHPEQCASVMQRLRDDASLPALGGNPELWRLVLDRMAGDESVPSVQSVLQDEIPKRFTVPNARELAAKLCFEFLVRNLKSAEELGVKLVGTGCDTEVIRLLRYRAVQISLAASMLTTAVAKRNGSAYLTPHWPADLVLEVASSISERQVKALQRLARKPRDAWSATLVSLLVARYRSWRPLVPIRRLNGAILCGVSWVGIDLSGADLTTADFAEAELSDATLDRAVARSANLQNAHLGCASFCDAEADGANLRGARLVKLVATQTSFRRVDAEGTDFRFAMLSGTNFMEANLTNARFRGADLSGARLLSAVIDGADFSNAILDGATLQGLRLRDCVLEGARFRNAVVSGCDLEFVQLTDADFSGANLTGAYLTGSQLPGANFRGATLCQAGLADVDWEGADLRDADFKNCSFHLGSARSGLVESPLASEGTRTGFYTDEFLEQSFKPPETVRKANLRGADLRGANIDGVDFYLVDLRDAVYTGDQRRHFESCRAVLEDRCP
jgi:uncharacterized protein YjbI with pentapeptide repeats